MISMICLLALDSLDVILKKHENKDLVYSMYELYKDIVSDKTVVTIIDNKFTRVINPKNSDFAWAHDQFFVKKEVTIQSIDGDHAFVYGEVRYYINFHNVGPRPFGKGWYTSFWKKSNGRWLLIREVIAFFEEDFDFKAWYVKPLKK